MQVIHTVYTYTSEHSAMMTPTIRYIVLMGPTHRQRLAYINDSRVSFVAQSQEHLDENGQHRPSRSCHCSIARGRGCGFSLPTTLERVYGDGL